ncbi:hypothetical protein R9C00_20660 [Flammeovirgaceae bacterium SG7u.111]|nr:hypothetical protein [Flammeovirgaceae bacterium SG7u.132]WPO34115.1 hypothetical protein R9C00_20660 [Flammeovirgaceae bacterium SG7u.111]
MGVGYLILPFIVLLFYVIPIGIALFSGTSRKAKFGVLAIPVAFTLIFAIRVVWDKYQTSKKIERLPQANKLTFRSSNSAVRDSIIEIKNILKKLPTRRDHGSVSYSIDKYSDSYGQFNFNWARIGHFQHLTKRGLQKVKLKELSEWGTQDKTPFDTLSSNEAERLVKLIEFLDYNQLNGAELNSFGDISLTYNDSLRISENIGFRKVVLDTTKSFPPNLYHCFDSKDGLYLVKRVKK